MICRMMKNDVVKEYGLSREVAPSEAYGPEFRLHVRKYDELGNRLYFVGQFPYCIGQDGNARDTQRGSFWGWDGRAGMDTER